jgi:tetratricopeptide (TPR) repeat protein
MGTADEARELALQALADGQLLDDPGPESGAFWIAPSVLFFAYADDDAARVSVDGIEWAKQHGSLPAFSMATQLRAYASVRRGLLAEAEADAASAIEQAEHQTLYAHVALVNVLLARGNATEAADVFARVRPEPAATGQIRYLQTRARIRAASQRPEDALEDLFACERLEQEWDIRTPAFSTWRTDAAPLLASLNRLDEAHALARAELERCRAFGAQAPLGGSLRTLGVLERGDAGIEFWRKRSHIWTGHRRGSSRRSRWSSWAPRSAAPGGAPTPASHSAKRSNWPVRAVRTRSPRARTMSSSPLVPALAETPPRAGQTSPRRNCG